MLEVVIGGVIASVSGFLAVWWPERRRKAREVKAHAKELQVACRLLHDEFSRIHLRAAFRLKLAKTAHGRGKAIGLTGDLRFDPGVW